ncbi:MAG TPA: transcriptional repressor [Candidatus Omnitrophica bacterium]|nr:MAG: hypothetical protein A2Z81_03410 [Omnitrophica WOR_2 bacterium GWA2_45_18]HBR14339.1 transcriptional repressor [Candidatus Omnitrophota bacterium]
MTNDTVKELEIFDRHISKKGLKHSQKRDYIITVFLSTTRHVSVDDLFQIVRKKHPEIGATTVYRTLKLIVSSGLAEEVDFDDGVKRFERKMGREYHAHFICTDCGYHFEVFDKNIKRLSHKLSEASGFHPKKHRLEIFGLCKKCGPSSPKP